LEPGVMRQEVVCCVVFVLFDEILHTVVVSSRISSQIIQLRIEQFILGVVVSGSSSSAHNACSVMVTDDA